MLYLTLVNSMSTQSICSLLRGEMSSRLQDQNGCYQLLSLTFQYNLSFVVF